MLVKMGLKKYHNVIKQEQKPGPLDHTDGAGGMVDGPFS